ncbi:gamma-glutamyl-gamma-aminobutyrate hydrolase family protein [Streptomyces sp. bgisy031]|uniref:gamma-glutamyl-gamma-aminobutyrate hydrolase family protein n=1 Tax=Streptomyces sp. bgisy031 TaxID=3413772 RepID=UPI003D73B443
MTAGLRLRVCRVWAGDPLPESLARVEALVVTGGPMAAHGDAGFPARHAELDLLREALGTEVPVLGVCPGARLLAVAAGGAARTGSGSQVNRTEVRTGPAADRDPLLDLGRPYAGRCRPFRRCHSCDGRLLPTSLSGARAHRPTDGSAHGPGSCRTPACPARHWETRCPCVTADRTRP